VPYDFETIGPYTIVDILGQGGMGTVYKGVHAKSKDTVAIKVSRHRSARSLSPTV
jgi:serine/threonine protein kinase